MTEKKPLIFAKMELANHLAEKIQEHYEFRYGKCVDMAMQGAWWYDCLTQEHLDALDIESLAATVIHQIDTGEIM